MEDRKSRQKYREALSFRLFHLKIGERLRGKIRLPRVWVISPTLMKWKLSTLPERPVLAYRATRPVRLHRQRAHKLVRLAW